ncbi:MAG TPA: HAMP domain-containing sensor histidine kinase [Anaeromyxobacteraceae bacterium]|nr:HAMP domain-containing sensor histidine kinase [Anaeromyxobacteraceae bacterium]
MSPRSWRRHRASGHGGGMFWRVYRHGLLLLALVALAVAGVGWALGRTFPGRNAEAVARYAALRAAELADRPDALERELQRVREAFGLEITFYGPAGAFASTAEPPHPPLPPAELPHLAQGPFHVLGRGFVFAAPLPDGRGYLLIGGPVHQPHLGRAALVIAAVLVALAIGSIPLARSIASPIERLTAAARALGGGDLSARVRLRAGGEVGELASAFDEMGERLERLVRGERELLANVSHELRTPLARIRVALELAAEGDLDRARRFLAEIGADLDELDRLVEEILTAARLDLASRPGGLPVHREPLQLSAVVGAAAERFRSEHPGRALEVDVEPPLPAVEGDPSLLARLLRNLLDNAHKYSDAEEPVVLAARARGGKAIIEVRDRGIGIDAADLPRLFTPFFRTDRSRARGTGGVGLGLALARRIAEAHGGAIEAESAPGKGTTLRVTLPAPAAGG